jgi:hypothetical protein
VRWLLSVLLVLSIGFASPGPPIEVDTEASIAALDAVFQPGALPKPSFELRRPALLDAPHALERLTPSWAPHLRVSLFSRSPAGPRAIVVRSRPRRHVPRMGSDDPDLT